MRTINEKNYRRRILAAKRTRRFSFAAICVLWVIVFSANLAAQDLPGEIRGYKVYHQKVSVAPGGKNADADFGVRINFGTPEIEDVSFSGVKFTLAADITALGQSGRVDFLTFKDFRVNNLAVEIKDYRKSFEFKKDKKISLAAPLEIYLPLSGTLRGAWKEMKESKPEWTVTGRVFVFGQFKKFGFKFKRVVPVDVNLKIKNFLPADATRKN